MPSDFYLTLPSVERERRMEIMLMFLLVENIRQITTATVVNSLQLKIEKAAFILFLMR